MSDRSTATDSYKAYVLCHVCGDQEPCSCKPGHSKNPEQRRRNLQTGSSFRLSFAHIEDIGTRADAARVENDTRRTLIDWGGKRLSGEWVGDTTREKARQALLAAAERHRRR